MTTNGFHRIKEGSIAYFNANCRHSEICPSCQRRVCTNDELSYCNLCDCIEVTWGPCIYCTKTDEPLEFICKPCFRDLRRSGSSYREVPYKPTCDNCGKLCGRLRQLVSHEKYNCFTCAT